MKAQSIEMQNEKLTSAVPLYVGIEIQLRPACKTAKAMTCIWHLRFLL